VQTVPAIYQNASRNAIQLAIEFSDAAPSYPAAVSVTAYQLHLTLSAVTGNSLNPLRIAVLFASSYDAPLLPIADGAFGLMFDRGFKTDDDPNDPMQRPRTGCVVFLDTIRAQRSKTEYIDEVVFTTLHELGHVFNLWHIADGANIMTPSNATGVIAKNYWNFEANQQAWLCNCGNDTRVTPGGDPYSGDAQGFNVPLSSRAPRTA
jgi:hypothetical protein